MADVIIFVGVVGAVALIVGKKINDVKSGKTGCGCSGCSGCKTNGQCQK